MYMYINRYNTCGGGIQRTTTVQKVMLEEEVEELMLASLSPVAKPVVSFGSPTKRRFWSALAMVVAPALPVDLVAMKAMGSGPYLKPL